MGLLEEEDRRWFKLISEAIGEQWKIDMERELMGMPPEEKTEPLIVLPGKVEDLGGPRIRKFAEKNWCPHMPTASDKMKGSAFCAATVSREGRSEMAKFNGYEVKQPHVGDVVIFTDEHGIDYNALVTAVFGDAQVCESEHYPEGESLFMPCLNAVWVSGDDRKQDPYGRQIERDHTSIVHAHGQPAGGVYWRWPGDPKNPVIEPTER